MPSTLMFADTMTSADMRREIPRPAPDSILFVEHDGVRTVVVRSHEVPDLSELPNLQVLAWDTFGLSELIREGMEQIEATWEIAGRVVSELGVTRAVVPAQFPLAVADRLRAKGIELEVDRVHFANLRRAKGSEQLAGIRRAEAAAEAGTRAAARLLNRATVEEGGVVVADGEPVTCERVKQDVLAAVFASGATLTEFIVAHGAQTSVATLGSGTILAGEPITVDLWPRDVETGCYTDITRTFVVGEISDELAEYQVLVSTALENCIAAVKPGLKVGELYGIAADVIEAAGYPTMRSKKPGEVLFDGFFHTLGHGVGLEGHEYPWLNLSDEELRVDDVIAVEPGCYRHGFGGVRFEDVIHVTADGRKNLTSLPCDLDPAVTAEN